MPIVTILPSFHTITVPVERILLIAAVISFLLCSLPARIIRTSHCIRMISRRCEILDKCTMDELYVTDEARSECQAQGPGADADRIGKLRERKKPSLDLQSCRFLLPVVRMIGTGQETFLPATIFWSLQTGMKGDEDQINRSVAVVPLLPCCQRLTDLGVYCTKE